MKKYLFCAVVFAILLGSCQPAPPQATSTEIESPPTQTAVDTVAPEPTALPGSLVIPLDSFGSEVPWLPLDTDARPTVIYIGINTTLAPFDNVDVRRAFAAATDREAIAGIAQRLYFENVRPATNFTPSETIGRDLYGEVGIPYDPERAKEYLSAAGYTDQADFPAFTLIASLRGSAAIGFYTQVSDALAAMWKENLGVDVTIEIVGDFGNFIDRVSNDAPQLWLLGWGADLNDPDNFLNYFFNSGAEANAGHFSSAEFDELVNEAAGGGDADQRQILYIQAERIVTEDLVGVIPLFHSYFYTGGG